MAYHMDSHRKANDQDSIEQEPAKVHECCAVTADLSQHADRLAGVTIVWPTRRRNRDCPQKRQRCDDTTYRQQSEKWGRVGVTPPG
jgi:hypothetical protein